jgi:Integrase core domain
MTVRYHCHRTTLDCGSVCGHKRLFRIYRKETPHGPPAWRTLFRSLPHARAVLEAWRTDYNTERPHSRLGWMSPSTYAAARRSAALRSTDGSAPRTAATTAQQGMTDRQTPLGTG